MRVLRHEKRPESALLGGLASTVGAIVSSVAKMSTPSFMLWKRSYPSRSTG
jgi:hypothetical protein